MLYKKRYLFNKIDQDLAPDKRDAKTHWNIVNMEVFLTSRGASAQVAKGPLEFPALENDKLAGFFVIGHGYINDKLFIFTTDNTTENNVPTSTDSIFEVTITKTTLALDLINQGNWGLSTYYPIDCRGIKEHEESEKLYWVDGLNQARFTNVLQIPADPIVDFVRANPTRGLITAVPYGSVATTNAVTRYAYTQYNLGGSESKFSELTNPINISTTGDSAHVTITGLSDEYTNVRVYRIAWSAYNAAPTYDIIKEAVNAPTIQFVDDGTLYLSTISIEELVDLGSDLIIPNTIEAKKQRLFFANYRVEAFEVDLEVTDLRAYGFSSGSQLTLESAEGVSKTYTGFDDPDLLDGSDTSLDAVNPDKYTYQYQADGSTRGLEGPYISLELVRELGSATSAKQRVHKQGETYRVGIVCQDELGRGTSAYWVGDLTIPYTGTEGAENTDYKPYYKVMGTLKSIPPGSGIVTWKFVYVKRDLANRSVVMQGVVQPVMDYKKSGDTVGLFPFPNMKEVKGNTSGTKTWFDVRHGYLEDFDWPKQVGTPVFAAADLYSDTAVNIVITPDSLLRKTDLPGTAVRCVGTAKIQVSKDFTRFDYGRVSTTFFTAETFPGMEFKPDEILEFENPGTANHAPPSLFGGFKDFNSYDGKGYLYAFYTRRADRFYLCADLQNDTPIDFCRFMPGGGTVTIDSSIIQNVIDEKNFAGYWFSGATDDNTTPSNYTGEFGDAFVFKADALDWAGAIENYSNFGTAPNFGTTVDDRGFPVVDILQIVTQQYGGSSYESKSFNIYIDSSQGNNQVGVATQLFGDVYNGVYFFAKCTSAYNTTQERQMSVFDYIALPMESEVSVEVANKLLRETDPNFSTQAAGNFKVLEVRNLMTYNTVFSQIPNSIITPAKPFNFVDIKEYLTRITPSNVKYSGEPIDNWTKINLGTYLDLESPYGEIVKLIRSVDNVYAFQPKGIAYISISPEKQVTTATGNIQLGKGDVLDNYQYLSINSGCGNRMAIAGYDKEIFFIDTVNRTLNSLTEGELSTLKGFNSLSYRLISETAVASYNYNDPDGGIVVINNHLKEVLFHISSEFPTLVYNFATKQFTNTRTYKAYYHVAFKNRVIGAVESKLYVNDEGIIGDYYGEHQDAEIIMYVEPVPGMDKVFDAVRVMKEGVGNFEKIEITSPTRTSGIQPLTFKSKFDVHTAHLPRVLDSRDRWRERNLKLRLIYEGVEPLDVDEIFIKFSLKKQ